MAVKTFWHYDVAAGSYGKMDEGSAPTAADTASKGSWNVQGASGFGFCDDLFVYNSTVTCSDGDSFFAGSPNGSNGFRSLNTLNGTFALGTWTFSVDLVGNGTNASVSIKLNFRLWKSVNANGTSATAIGSLVNTASTTHKTTTQVISGTTPSLAAQTFTNEYLFITLGYDINANVNASGITTVRVGSTKLVTTDFTPTASTYNETVSESATPTDLFSAQQVFACPITETPIVSWGSSGVHWTWVDAVWGGSTLIEWGSTAIYNVPIVETATAAELLTSTSIMPAALTEARTAADSFVPELVFNFTLNESRTPADALTTFVTFNQNLTESLVNFWGTAGILWGATTGTWGGDVQDSLSSQQIFISSLTESRTATDAYVGNTIFPNTLSESTTPLDSFIPALLIPVSLTESGTASESLTANNIMVASLVEVLANYWGSSGILWGPTTGTWGGDVQDSLSAQQVFACPLLEINSASDIYVAVQVFVSSLSEPVAATDIYVPNLVISGSLVEVNGAIDGLSAQQVFSNFLIELRTADVSLSFTIVGSASNVVVVDPTLSIFGTSGLKDPLGVDLSSFPDFDPLGVLVFGLPALCQRIARRLTNSRGSWAWAPNEGTDTRQYLNDLVSKERISVIQNEVEREVLREEAVKTVTSKISFDLESSILTLSLTGITSEGPFKFVFEVTSSKLTILN